MTAFFLPARAKLNLVLRVVGRRADGYHLLETLFQALDLHDDLWLRPGAPGLRLSVTAEDPRLLVAPGPDNLVEKALARFAAAAGRPLAFDVHLHKRIPHGGGLGGGSSDAAAALRLAQHCLGEPLAAAELHRVAVGLGADVPFFLTGGSQWGRGIGDELEPVALPPLWCVLLVPPFGCPTADVYKNHAALWIGGRPQVTVTSITVPHTRDSAVRMEFVNELEPAAERVRPELKLVRATVADLGYPQVRMSGSGSTLYVPWSDAAAAAACADRLRVLERDGVRILVAASHGGRLESVAAGAWPEPGARGGPHH